MIFINKYQIKSRNIPIILATDLIGGILFFLPFLALYFEQSLFSIKNVAIIFAVESIAAAIFEVPTGAVSDLFGRKKTYITTYAVMLLSIVFLWIGGSMLMFIMYAVLYGLVMALASGTGQSIIYDSLKEEGKEKYYKKTIGVYYSVWPFGATIGSIGGGYLASISLQTTVTYTFIPVLISLILTFFLKEPKYHKAESNSMLSHIGSSCKTIINNNQLLLLLTGSLIMLALGESMHFLNPLFFKFKELPIIYFGYVSAIVFGLSSFGHYISNWVSEKVGNKRTLLLVVFMSPFLTILATIADKYLAIVFFILTSIFFGIKNPIYDHFFNSKIPSSHRATIISINNLVTKGGIAVASPFVGYLVDLYTVNTAFLMSACILMIVPIMFLFIKDK